MLGLAFSPLTVPEASDARLFAFPAALSAAALGSGRSEELGLRLFPMSLAVPLACSQNAYPLLARLFLLGETLAVLFICKQKTPEYSSATLRLK